jgi:hypothetical protein
VILIPQAVSIAEAINMELEFIKILVIVNYSVSLMKFVNFAIEAPIIKTTQHSEFDYCSKICYF